MEQFVRKQIALETGHLSCVVRRVLVDEKILPDPGRHAPRGIQTPWRKFIAMHMNVMVACDFFCKTAIGQQTGDNDYSNGEQASPA